MSLAELVDAGGEARGHSLRLFDVVLRTGRARRCRLAAGESRDRGEEASQSESGHVYAVAIEALIPEARS